MNLNVDKFLNNDFHKKRMLFIENTLRTLSFIKVSLKSSGSSISEKIHQAYFTNAYIFTNTFQNGTE